MLHLREGEDDLLNGYRLRSIIEKYSDHISLPILMPGGARGPGRRASRRTGTPKPDVTVNQASALWARPKSELTEQDYSDFYRHIAGEFTDPLAWVHSKIEGTYEYTLLLFIPSRAPYDLWVPQPGRGVRLHIRRVFIMEDTGQLMPQYLRFIRGVIDSSDLPLNVSREILQGSRVVDNIRVQRGEEGAAAARRAGRERAGEVRHVLEGVRHHPQGGHRRRLLATGTRSPSCCASPPPSPPPTSRTSRSADYVGRMKEGQEDIYYLLAPEPGRRQVQPAPGGVPHEGRGGAAAGRGRGQLGGRPACASSTASGCSRSPRAPATWARWRTRQKSRPRSRPAPSTRSWSAKLKAFLAGQAWDVRVTSRLTTSPACIVANEPEIDINLACSGCAAPACRSQPVLEINPQHPLIQRLNRGPADPQLAEWAQVLFNQAVLTLGARIEDPAAFVTRLNGLLVTLSGAAEAVPDGNPARGRGPCPGPGALADVPCAPAPPGQLLAVSDLHVTFPAEPGVVGTCRPARRTTGCWSPGTWPRRRRTSSGRCARSRDRFAHVVWVPGNHDLWTLIPRIRSSCAARPATSTWWRCAASSA